MPAGSLQRCTTRPRSPLISPRTRGEQDDRGAADGGGVAERVGVDALTLPARTTRTASYHR
jgi:hypothetical protein